MAQGRHKRDTNARKIKLPVALVAAPAAVLVTAPAVGLGVWAADPHLAERVGLTGLTASVASAADPTADVDLAARADLATRSGGRGAGVSTTQLRQQADRRDAVRATRAAVRGAETTRWTATELNLWSASGAGATQVGEIAAGKKVLVTGRRADGRVELALAGQSRWVTEGYLVEEKPEGGIVAIGGACTNGTSAGGANANVQKVHQAVCAAFPEISGYGTLRGGGGDHPLGRAVDIMVSGERGWQVAEFVRAHYAVLGVSYVIYAQRIWSVERGGEGWRPMASRGSATANHYDHVHVSTY